MPTSDFMLGLNIGEASVQAVEIQWDGSSVTLLAIDEWRNTLLARDRADNAAGREEFSAALGTFLKVNRVRARNVSVALDTGFLFLQTVPMDEGLARREITERIRWELGRYFPDEAPETFVSDVHRLADDGTDRAAEYLCVSLRRQVARTIEDVLTDHGLSLHVLDIDHFSADTALRFNYPDASRRRLALVAVKQGRIDISHLDFGNLQGYRYDVVRSSQDILDAIGRYSRETQNIAAITAFGTHLDTDLLQDIRRASALLVEALNPLRRVSVSPTVRMPEHLAGPAYRYAAAIGAALRRD